MKKRKQPDLMLEAVRELSRDLKTNDYVAGTAQFTDMTNTDYFLKVYGGRVRFCKPWNKFLVWDGKRWKIDEYGEVGFLVDELIRNMYKGAREIKDPLLRIDFERHIKKCESLRRRKALLESVSMSKKVMITNEQLDDNRFLFNCENGTINLLDGTFKNHSENDFSTKCSKFVFDPKAICPTWDRFLLQIMNKDLELIYYLQKVMGYALTADVSEQVLFILWGAGANGKSTFLNVILDLMGDYSGTTSSETFMKGKSDGMSNDLARLRGLRLVSAAETEQGKRLSETLVKQATGQDKLMARFLYGEYFEFYPTFKIFLATNHKPTVKGNDYGIWRRIRLIPFTVTIPPEERDKDLFAKLKAENSGILNWLLRGCEMWRKEGLGSAESVEAATEEYRNDMDTVGQFVHDCFVVEATPLTRVTNKELYEAYYKWCSRNNEKAISQKLLTLRLQEKGFVRKVSTGERYWKGFRLKEWM